MYIRAGILFSIVWLLIAGGAVVAVEEKHPVYFRWDGGVSGSKAGKLPERLDSSDVLRWRTPIDPGHSTPIACRDRVFLTTFNPRKDELATLALSVDNGKILWKKIAPASHIEEFNYSAGSAAQATPACDGHRVYVFFGSYGLICYDLQGKQLWEHRMGPFQDEYGSASSPILVDGKVIVQQDHDVDSFLMALDSETGKVLWKTERPDAVRSYSTPAVWMRNGRKELLVAGALELAGYDPSNGKKLWWIQGLARIVIPTPVPAGDRVYMSSWSPGGEGLRRARMETWSEALRYWDRDGNGKLSQFEVRNRDVQQRYNAVDTDRSGDLDKMEWQRYAAVFQGAQNGTLAVKPSSRDGEQDNSAIIWRYDRNAPYVATPLLDKGILWIVKDGGIATKLSAASGKLLQQKRLPGIGNYYASPMTADGKVYFASQQGVVSILANEEDWRVLSYHDFYENIYATPVVTGNRLIIRTEKALYCFQKLRSAVGSGQ